MAEQDKYFIDFATTYNQKLDIVEKRVLSSPFRFFSWLSNILGIVSIFYLLLGLFIWPSLLYLGLALIALSFFIFVQGYLGYYGFLKNYLAKVHFTSLNLADYLDISTYRLLKNYKDTISSSDLGMDLLKNLEVNILLWRLELDPAWLKQVLAKEKGPIFSLIEILASARSFVLSLGKQQIDPKALFIILAERHPVLASIISRQRIEGLDLRLIYEWFKKEKPSFFTLRFTGGIAQDWASGYSPILDRVAFNLGSANLASWEALAHQKIKEELKEILLESRKGNILLVGRPGIGKRSMVVALAKDLASGKCPYALAYKRILELKMEQILTAGRDEAGIRALFGEALTEVFKAGDVMLYFDDFSVLCGGGKALGKANLMDLILPFLKHPGFHIIASISPSNYEQYITKNEALLEEFNLLEIKEPSFAENILILQGLCSTYESYLQIFFTFPAIKRIMELSQKYLWKEPFPMKAIHLLEKVTQYAMANKLSLIGKEIIEDVFEEMTKIKVGKIKQQEKNLLLNLENIFHQRVVDQEEAIKLLAEAVRIKRAGIKSSPKPIGSFLFLGPTGVGKTETAKTLAQCYFGSEDTMIRFDMSEYQNKQDVYRFIGNPRTQMPGQLTEAVKENPFALILLDEIEKAHPDILNLFLQVLDEGFLTDVFGQKVYFSNHIIIATSNAGSDYLIQLLKNKLPFSDIQKRLFDYLIKQRLFRVELLNRFDKVIYFKPLGLNEILQIANIKIGQLKDELFSLKRINLEIGPEAVKTLALLGYKEEFGARELERTIREKVESLIAKKIIEESASSGGSIHIGVEDLVVENKVNS